jgi:hypothetical protein
MEEAKSMNSPEAKRERVGGAGRKITRSNSRWGESDRLKNPETNSNLDHQ